MVSSIVVIDYFFKIKAGNYAVCVTIHTFYTIGFCWGFVDPRALHCLILTHDFVLEDILNVLPGLSKYALVFISIFPAFLMGACGFCLSCSGFMGDKFF